jgi:hypothetical protein
MYISQVHARPFYDHNKYVPINLFIIKSMKYFILYCTVLYIALLHALLHY